MYVMDEYEVVAIDGEGVFVTDGERAWQLGGHVDGEPTDKLQADYKNAINS